MKNDGKGVPADGIGVFEISVLLVQTQHLLEGTCGVEGLLLALGQLVVRHQAIFYLNSWRQCIRDVRRGTMEKGKGVRKEGK